MHTTQKLTLAELETRQLREILETVLLKHIALTVQLPDGDEVVIQPKARLKPLPVLNGYIPDGWRDAIYDAQK